MRPTLASPDFGFWDTLTVLAIAEEEALREREKPRDPPPPREGAEDAKDRARPPRTKA